MACLKMRSMGNVEKMGLGRAFVSSLCLIWPHVLVSCYDRLNVNNTCRVARKFQIVLSLSPRILTALCLVVQGGPIKPNSQAT